MNTPVDIAIIGASTGGCAAALSAEGQTVLTEETDWIGGQFTAQGVSAPDEHAYIETFGSTRTYADLRAAIRQLYQTRYNAPAIMAESVLGPNMPLNPGNGWVSRLCFLPAHGLEVLEGMLSAAAVWRGETPVSAAVDNGQIKHLTLRSGRTISARYFLDATDLGDLLPLAGAPFLTGAESQAETGEPHAAPEARPGETQGFTACFAVEYRPGENHIITPPEGYADFRHYYTLSPTGRDGQPVIYRMFENSVQGNLPFWSYRRLYDGALLGGNDIALINWISNDYHGRGLLEDYPRALDEAKRLSLGFLYWLQTECPRDDGQGEGYPELKLRLDVMGTADGLSKTPYIRESRRIVPLQRVVEQDITAEFNPGARARHFSSSVGIGWYAMDLHPCVGNPTVSMYAPTKPFQIPLGALIPQGMTNLIAACKNIGTTHLTNGAYRLHPIEWAIGEAAGALASFCIRQDLTPQQVLADPWQVWRLQYALVARGCPVFWAVDVPVGHAAFLATQLLLVRDVIVPQGDRWTQLEIGLDQPLGDSIDLIRLQALADELNTHLGQNVVSALRRDLTWAATCAAFHPGLEAALR
ncbi:MAG: FAD-dependent oxidoreductase [Anaerolineae bacterium]